MSQQFFGHPESPLFGIYHPAHGTHSGTSRAVVVCPSIGHEYIRTHWNLRLLSNQIARKGIAVLRFDYHGIGDSTGDVQDVSRLDVWRRDILAAIDHVKQLSGAETVMLLGQRFGGLLAGQIAQQCPDVNSVVLWEPITRGANFVDQWRAMHREMLDLWVCRMTTANDESQEEILASVYQRSLCREIEQATLDTANIIQPQLIVVPEVMSSPWGAGDASLQRVIFDQRPGAWDDLQQLETAFLRPLVNQQVVKLVKDMFVRLQKFDALRSPSSDLCSVEARG